MLYRKMLEFFTKKKISKEKETIVQEEWGEIQRHEASVRMIVIAEMTKAAIKELCDTNNIDNDNKQVELIMQMQTEHIAICEKQIEKSKL